MVTQRKTTKPARRRKETPEELDARHQREFEAAGWTPEQIDAAHGLDPSRPEIQEAMQRAREWHADQKKKRERKRALSSPRRSSGP